MIPGSFVGESDLNLSLHGSLLENQREESLEVEGLSVPDPPPPEVSQRHGSVCRVPQ